MISLVPLYLLISGCSLTAKPEIVYQTRVVREKVPDAYVRPCKKKQRGKVVNPTVATLTGRLRYTEGALEECGAQVDAVAEWNKGQ